MRNSNNNANTVNLDNVSLGTIKTIKGTKEELLTAEQKAIKERIMNNNFSCKDDRDRIVDAFKRLPNKYNKLHTFGVYNEVTHFDVTLDDKTYSVVDLDTLKDEARWVCEKLQSGKSVTVRGINFFLKDGRMVAGRGRYYTADINKGNILDIILYWMATAIFTDFELGLDHDFDEYYKYREKTFYFDPRYEVEEYKDRVSAVADGKSDEDYEAIADDIEGDIITIYDGIVMLELDNSDGMYDDDFNFVTDYLEGLKDLIDNCKPLYDEMAKDILGEIDEVLDYIDEQ